MESLRIQRALVILLFVVTITNANFKDSRCPGHFKPRNINTSWEPIDGHDKNHTRRWNVTEKFTDNTFRKIPRVIMLLDETGSMNEITGPTIQAYNDFLTDARQIKPGEKYTPKFTSIQFADFAKPHVFNDIANAEFLNTSKYIPHGCTALYDTIGCALDYYASECIDIFLVITDGEDNCSKIYTAEEIYPKISKLAHEHCGRDDGWQFLFVGPDGPGHAKVPYELGIETTIFYQPDAEGIYYALNKTRKYLSQMRSQAALKLEEEAPKCLLAQGWTEFKSTDKTKLFVKGFTVRKNWEDANKYCNNFGPGVTLSEPRTNEELEQFVEYIRENVGYGYTWVGARVPYGIYPFTQNDFRYITDGSSLLRKWHKYFGNYRYYNSPCVDLQYASRIFSNRNYCAKWLFFTCEYRYKPSIIIPSQGGCEALNLTHIRRNSDFLDRIHYVEKFDKETGKSLRKIPGTCSPPEGWKELKRSTGSERFFVKSFKDIQLSWKNWSYFVFLHTRGMLFFGHIDKVFSTLFY